MMIPMTNFTLLRKVGFNKNMYRRLAKALGGIRNYGPHIPIHIIKILNTCGLYSAVWALRACPCAEKFALSFAYDCAEHALRGQNNQFNEVLKVAQHIVHDATKADEILTAQNMLQEALQKVTTVGDTLAITMLLKLISKPPLETAYSVATRAAAYVDNIDSHHHSPPWMALQHEMEWQEQHFVELLNKEDDKNEN